MPPALRTLSASMALFLLAGCAATTPARRADAPPPDCQAIRTEMAAARAARQAALDEQTDAWKGVLPPFIVGRYVSGANDAALADDRISTLQRHAFRQDCHAG